MTELSVPQQKAGLRRRLREALAQMPPAAREAASAQARALLLTQRIWRNARSVLLFAPQTWELDIWPLISEALAAGKLAALPRFRPAAERYTACQIRHPAEDVAPGRFGIREPVEGCAEVPLERLDLVLVPGLAFDPHGWRLGRGGGVFDRLLSTTQAVKCGVGFDEQLVPEVPVEPHDVQVDCILTPSRWVEV